MDKYHIYFGVKHTKWELHSNNWLNILPSNIFRMKLLACNKSVVQTLGYYNQPSSLRAEDDEMTTPTPHWSQDLDFFLENSRAKYDTIQKQDNAELLHTFPFSLLPILLFFLTARGLNFVRGREKSQNFIFLAYQFNANFNTFVLSSLLFYQNIKWNRRKSYHNILFYNTTLKSIILF